MHRSHQLSPREQDLRISDVQSPMQIGQRHLRKSRDKMLPKLEHAFHGAMQLESQRISSAGSHESSEKVLLKPNFKNQDFDTLQKAINVYSRNHKTFKMHDSRGQTIEEFGLVK